MAYTKYKDAYLDAFRKGLVGESYKDTLPDVSSNNPYAKQMNEELEIGTFAHDLGITLRDNMFGAPSNPDDEVPNGNNHHHDDRYAKLIHNHDDRYYTKDEEDAWRDRLINGDLLFNKINANHIQAGTIVAGSGIIADGAIGSAQISRLDAGKIESGTIDTSKLTIMGANGNLLIRGNRLQVFEGMGLQQYERVSLGDVNNDGTIYGLRVRGKDGNTILYDENGVYREGITDGSITNDKIGDDANIDGGKLDIGSVIRKINEDGSETINGVKIQVDSENLLAKLSTITLNQNEHSESIRQNTASIEANSKSIKLKVDEQKYTEDMSAMTSELEKQTASIEVLKEGIELKANKTEVTNQIKEVKDFVSSEVGDISVGSANYVNNSAPRKATVDEFITWDRTLNGNHRLTYWEDYNDTVELPQVGYHAHIDLKTFHFPCIALINRNATYSMANRFLGVKQEIHKSDEYIRPNEYVTISFDAYADTFNFNFHGGLYHRNVESEVYGYHSGNMQIRVPQENVGLWRRYSYTFKTHVGIDLSQPMYLHILGHNNPEASGYVKNIKLEHGKLVSQWTPSAFDVDDSLDDAVDSMKDYTNESIKTYDAEVQVKFNNINLSVSETVKDLEGVKGSVSSIDIKANQISSKVTDLTGKYTELKQTVDGIDITGMVTFNDLLTSGSTVIHGDNLKTGTVYADYLRGTQLTAMDEINFDGGARFTILPVSGFRGLNLSTPCFQIGARWWTISYDGDAMFEGTLDVMPDAFTNSGIAGYTSGFKVASSGNASVGKSIYANSFSSRYSAYSTYSSEEIPPSIDLLHAVQIGDSYKIRVDEVLPLSSDSTNPFLNEDEEFGLGLDLESVVASLLATMKQQQEQIKNLEQRVIELEKGMN